MIVFFLTIDEPIEVSRICLNVADQVIYIQMVLLPNIILNFSSQSFKFWSEFLTACLFCFSMSFVSSANLISEVIQGTDETAGLVLGGIGTEVRGHSAMMITVLFLTFDNEFSGIMYSLFGAWRQTKYFPNNI